MRESQLFFVILQANCDMDRSFRHRFTLPAKCAIVLFAALSLWFFWQRMPIVGLLVAIVVVAMTERLINSRYVLTDHSLIIIHGRFSRKKEIELREVVRCTPISGALGTHGSLLIEHGAGRLTQVQPVEEEVFMCELRKRQEEL